MMLAALPINILSVPARFQAIYVPPEDVVSNDKSRLPDPDIVTVLNFGLDGKPPVGAITVGANPQSTSTAIFCQHFMLKFPRSSYSFAARRYCCEYGMPLSFAARQTIQ